MPRYRQETEGPDGWTREILPDMDCYKMACCDCSLVHDVKFQVVEVTAVHGDDAGPAE